MAKSMTSYAVSEAQSNGSLQNGKLENGEKRNAWASAGPAAFDFRSDTLTTPTLSMLSSIQSCTLGDDVLAADQTTIELERWIAALLHGPAINGRVSNGSTTEESSSTNSSTAPSSAGLLVLSGTMGNQLAIASHLAYPPGPPSGVLAHTHSHCMSHEAGGMSSLSRAWPQPVTPKATIHDPQGDQMSLEDVKKVAVLESGDHHLVPTRLIIIENTINGAIVPLQTCKEICEWARSQTPPIKTHLDGARLWDCVAALVERKEFTSLEEGLLAYGRCFDSVTVCFSKGLGAPIGSLLVGKPAFIGQARHIRKSIGGGMRQTGIIAAPATVAVRETFFGGKLDQARWAARGVADLWQSVGGKLLRPVQTNMAWLDLDEKGISAERWMRAGEREGVKMWASRMVCHYQVSDEAMEALGRAMKWATSSEEDHKPKKRRRDEGEEEFKGYKRKKLEGEVLEED